MKSEVIRFTIFDSNPTGHGGEKRTAQISELLNKSQIEWVRIPTGMDGPSLKIWYIRRLVLVIKSFIEIGFILQRLFHPLKLYKSIRLASRFNGIFENNTGHRENIILWENTKVDFSFVITYFKKKGFRIIATPHNLESLVPDQKSGFSNRISPFWFNEELRLLKKCDQVFTISQEDTLLLRQFGIIVNFLPYFPSDIVYMDLMNIRDQRRLSGREKNGVKKVLILGSYMNPPTKQGIDYLIQIIQEGKPEFCEFSIAGYHTCELKKIIDQNEIIKLRGELTPKELHDAIIETDTVLIFQPPTSGALTRIVEMLIAGVPVITNFEGARSYYNTEGVHIYFDKYQLFELLKKDLPIPPIPVRPEKETCIFIDTIKKLIAE